MILPKTAPPAHLYYFISHEAWFVLEILTLGRVALQKSMKLSRGSMKPRGFVHNILEKVPSCQRLNTKSEQRNVDGCLYARIQPTECREQSKPCPKNTSPTAEFFFRN
jgi:hypothetical protein